MATAHNPAFEFTIHPSASPFAVTKQTYSSLHSHAGYGLVATGALVFSGTATDTPRILLVQRSARDTMPHQWEVPGGACDDDDETILHAAARELWEEAGLKATCFREAVGNPHVFVTGSGKPICKLNFVVDVEMNFEDSLQPKLDPNEHQQFAWATEMEVRFRKVGDIELKFTSEQLEDAILRTFEELGRNSKNIGGMVER